MRINGYGAEKVVHTDCPRLHIDDWLPCCQLFCNHPMDEAVERIIAIVDSSVRLRMCSELSITDARSRVCEASHASFSLAENISFPYSL